MPQVSRRPISDKVNNRISNIFIKYLSRIKDKKEAEQFLEEFLTPTEQTMLSKRLSVAYLLAKGYEYRVISEILKVSTSTVRDFAIAYKHRSKFKKIIDSIVDVEKNEAFWLDLAQKASSILGTGAKGKTLRSISQELKTKKELSVF